MPHVTLPISFSVGQQRLTDLQILLILKLQPSSVSLKAMHFLDHPINHCRAPYVCCKMSTFLYPTLAYCLCFAYSLECVSASYPEKQFMCLRTLKHFYRPHIVGCWQNLHHTWTTKGGNGVENSQHFKKAASDDVHAYVKVALRSARLIVLYCPCESWTRFVRMPNSLFYFHFWAPICSIVDDATPRPPMLADF